MPSREEISGWLREVEREYKQLARDIKAPFNEPILKAQIKWGKRAKQVENMCCENCEYYIAQKYGEWTDSCNLNWLIAEVQGPGFGCWNFKQKVKQ